MFKKKKGEEPVPVEVVSMTELLKDLGIDHIRSSKNPLTGDLMLKESERPCPIALETRNDICRDSEGSKTDDKSALESAMKVAYEATEIVRSGSPVE